MREHSSKRPALKTDCANLSCISGKLITLQEILKISNKYFWFFKSFFCCCFFCFLCGGPYQSENIPYFENKALLSTPEVGLLSKDHSWLQFPVFSTERIPKFHSMWLSATNSPDGCVYVWEKLFTVNRNLLHTKYGVEEVTRSALQCDILMPALLWCVYPSLCWANHKPTPQQETGVTLQATYSLRHIN